MNEANRQIVGKTVLITGASGGIGSALVRAFLLAGATHILAASRTLVTASPRVLPLRLDVTDPVNVASFADKCATTVDILVNNAGVNGNSSALEPASLETAREEMEVNYFGTLNVIRAFAPVMRKRGSGVIVNMLTMLSHVNLPAMGSYCASKAAVLSLTQAVRAELASSGISVVAILPSAVDTRMSANAPGPKLRPDEVGEATVRAILEGVEEVYPGQVAADFHDSFRADPKALERRLASRLPTRRPS